MRQTLSIIVIVAAAAAAWGCGERPIVVQGTVVSYAAASGVVVVKDERPPNAEFVLSLEGSDIGAEPQPGDAVRIAYRQQGSQLRALRVMNLTRQAELRGKSSSGVH
jgi:hypothetical protein